MYTGYQCLSVPSSSPCLSSFLPPQFTPRPVPSQTLSTCLDSALSQLQKESFVELVERIGRKTGGLAVYPFTSPVRGKPHDPVAKIMVGLINAISTFVLF